jgi:hypothetical protein
MWEDVGQKWKLCRKLNKDRPPILGCSIFLIVSSGREDVGVLWVLLGWEVPFG